MNRVPLNESLMTNRRFPTPLGANRKLGHSVGAPSLLPAAVAYLNRYAARPIRVFGAFLCLATGILVGCGRTSTDLVHVTGIINGNELRLSRRMQHKLAEQSVCLLKSCTYANLHPVDGYASTIAHAEVNPHLHIILSRPRFMQLSVRKREVPSGKVDLEVRDILITLPVQSGAILVRSNEQTFYFAKFDCPLAQELEKTLRKVHP